MSQFSDVWDERSNIFITDIIPEENETGVPEEITFDATGPGGTRPNAWSAPTISVDTSSRFAVHEIVGGTTVRQKVGEDPIEIEVTGVCDEQTARDIDELRKTRLVTLVSDRLQILCQVAATSTSPMGDNYPADLETGALIYEYDISLVGIRG